MHMVCWAAVCALANAWQQNGQKDADDPDDHDQFHEGKPGDRPARMLPRNGTRLASIAAKCSFCNTMAFFEHKHSAWYYECGADNTATDTRKQTS